MSLAATIFADGAPCAPALRKRLSRGRFVIALDGAAERARREGWRPSLIAGDFDTVTKATLSHFKKLGTPLLPTPDQDHTDLEKALAWCALRDFDSIWICHALGGRTDHTFSALSLLKRFHNKEREVLLFQDNERIFFTRNETLVLDGKMGRSFAVLPFPACTATSSGLAYELKATALRLGVRESVSNQAVRKKVRLRIEGEALITEGI